ncbi:phosphotransferase, partial [Chloroflexota bacterium]
IFWRYVLRELERHLSDDETLTKCTQSIILSQNPPDIFDLNNLFDQISRAGRLVVLMLDEFEAIVENIDHRSPELLYRLRTLLNRPERGLTLIVASREPLDRLCVGIHFTGSPFDNSFSLIKLLPFSDAEVDELLTQYQADISASERAFLRQTAGNHPYLVQLTGGLIIRAREHQALEESPPSQLEVDLERDTERYFSDLLHYFSETETMLLTWLALAQLAQKLSLDLLKLGKLPKHLGGAYDQDLSRLVERGLVQYKAERPLLFSSIFGRWVLRKLVVTADPAELSDWQAHYANFLSSPQQEFFEDLVKKIIERQAVITNPELLKDFTRGDREDTSNSFVNLADSIRLTGPVRLTDKQERDVVRQLYGGEGLNIAQVRLEKEFHGGLSEARVILAQSVDNRNRGLAYEVIKIAPATMLRREHNRYQKFIRGRLPATAVRLENGPVELGTTGCLSYGFAGDRPVGTIMDLEAYYATHSVTEIINTLTNLTDTLDDRWYGQGEPLSASFADEYSRQLPAHLRLDAISISTSKDISVSSYRTIDIDTIQQAETQLSVGERVAISGLKVNQVTPETVKLRSAGNTSVIWIRTRVAMSRLDLQEEDRVVVMGIVERRRDDVFKTAGTNILNYAPDIRRQPNNMLHLPGLEQPCPNPLAIYNQVLKQPLNGRRAIIHGDLHPGNILVDEAGRAWLIDFDHVREGHVLLDFVRLETILRLFILGDIRRK